MATVEKDYKKIAASLAQRVIWALKYMNPKGGNGSVFHVDKGETQPWDDWFIDGLAEVGYVVDRKKYREMREGKKPTKTKRAKKTAA